MRWGMAKKMIFYPMLQVLFGYVDILPMNTASAFSAVISTTSANVRAREKYIFLYILLRSSFLPSNHRKPRNLSASMYTTRASLIDFIVVSCIF